VTIKNVPIPEEVQQRAATEYSVDQSGCWISNYAGQGNRYAGIDEVGGPRRYYAHRASWTHTNGPIPDGGVIDHLCRNRQCVNPDHLRAISLLENSKRQIEGIIAEGHCRWGHPDSDRIPVKPQENRWQKTACGTCLKEQNDYLVNMKKQLRLLEIAFGMGDWHTKRNYRHTINERNKRVLAIRERRLGLAPIRTDNRP